MEACVITRTHARFLFLFLSLICRSQIEMEPVNNGPPPNVIHTATMERCFKVAKNEDVVVRPIANFHPSLWGDYFITNVTLSSTHQACHTV